MQDVKPHAISMLKESSCFQNIIYFLNFKLKIYAANYMFFLQAPHIIPLKIPNYTYMDAKAPHA